MSNDLTKKTPTDLDNFAGWEDGVEGDDKPEGASIIQGTLVKFSNEGEWVTRDGDTLAADLELVAADVLRVVQKWHDDHPVETTILEPHQKFPDVEQMNEETPKQEWVEGPDGQMRGPWQSQHILQLVDLKTMDKYTYPTGTVGGRIAIRELREKIMWMRRLRGPNVYAMVTLANMWMNTRFGGRSRPHFKIVRFIPLGGGDGEVEALPPPPTTPKQALDEFAKSADKPMQQTTAQPDLPWQEVKEPSLKEELNDEIPDFDNEKSPKASPSATKNEKSPKASPPRSTARRDLKKPTQTSTKMAGRKRSTILDAG
jgi:hypothetical protein